jgi:hypothetical protein
MGLIHTLTYICARHIQCLFMCMSLIPYQIIFCLSWPTASKHMNVSTFATYISFTQSELLYGSLQANHHYFKGNDIDKTQY